MHKLWGVVVCGNGTHCKMLNPLLLLPEPLLLVFSIQVPRAPGTAISNKVYEEDITGLYPYHVI